MFNSNNGYSLSDIAAVSGNNDDGFGGNGAWWIIILFLFVFCGWGRNGWGGGNGSGESALTRGELCMDMNFQGLENTARATNQGLSDGFYAMNTGMLNGFANLGAQTQQGFNTMNISNLQAANDLQRQLADCCCETREAIQGVNYNLATNTCAITTAMSNNTRDIIDSQQAGTRAILDYLCQEKISDLQNENQALRLAASQQAQNNYLVSTLRPAPVPAFAVPAPYQYGWNNGGCCCGNNVAI